jgi:poly-gamma-glutamate synthesis protein (capsule biosynthesis protein)
MHKGSPSRASLFCIRRAPLLVLWGVGALVAAHARAVAQEDTAEVILRFAGDCLLAQHYERAAGDDPGLAFKEFDLFRTADVGMVNLECPVSTSGVPAQKPFTFRMHPRFLPALKAAGVSIVNLANNHTFDYGDRAVEETLEHLDRAGIRHVGAGLNRESARRPVIAHVRGKRVAFLGYYGGEEAPVAGRFTPGVALRDLGWISDDIRLARTRDSADYVIVNLHWGEEDAESPSADQVRFARDLIRAGATAIVGHHPHSLQRIERYANGVIAYSLGNFLFGGNPRDSYDTGVLEIRLTAAGPRFWVVPVTVRQWRVRVPVGRDAARVLDILAQRTVPVPTISVTTQEQE